MYDPEQLKEKETKKSQVRQTAKTENLEPKPSPRIIDPKQKLKTYIIESSMVRDAMGLLMKKDGKLVVVDKEKIEKLDARTKELLREIYKELQ